MLTKGGNVVDSERVPSRVSMSVASVLLPPFGSADPLRRGFFLVGSGATRGSGAVLGVVLGLLGVLATSLPVSAQTCPQPFVLRQEACPGGVATCTTKGSTLTYQELDRDLLNAIGLCNGPGRYTWPVPGVGLFSSNGSGVISLVADDDTPDNDSEVPDAHTMNGGTLSGTNTVTGILNLDSGTEGTLRFPSSTNLPGTCTVGDSYWDTDADTTGSLFICGPSANSWKEVDDDGGAGGGAPTDATYLTLSTNATLINERVYTTGIGLSGSDGGAGGAFTISFWAGDTLASNPVYSTEDVVFTKDGTGGGLLFEGVTADTIEGILIWNPTTSDKTITLPDVSGAVVTTGDTGTVSTAMIANDAITTVKVGFNYATSVSEGGPATTATSLAANGTNCSSTQAATGVDADGNAEGCFTPAGGGGDDPLLTPEIVEEFCSRNTTAGVFGTNNWSIYGANAPGEVAGETNHPCIQSLFTSSISGNVNSIGMGKFSTTDNFKVADHLDRVWFVFKTDAAITSMELRVGFMEDINSTTGGDGFFVEYDDTVNGFFRCVTRASATTTTTNSAVTVAVNTWYMVSLERTAGGNHNCYVNSATSFATHTTNLPTNTLNLGFTVETKSAASRSILLDFFRLLGKTFSARY